MNHLANNTLKGLNAIRSCNTGAIPAAALPIQLTLDALFLTPDSVVVELGEEAGRFTLPVARYFEKKAGSGKVYACDFSDESVERLQQKAKDAHLEKYIRTLRLGRMRPHATRMPDDSIDAILAINPIEYQASPEPYLEECLRILRPGGGMFLAHRSDARTLARRAAKPFKMPVDTVFSTLKQSGAEICTTIAVSGYHWAVLVVKPLIHVPL